MVFLLSVLYRLSVRKLRVWISVTLSLMMMMVERSGDTKKTRCCGHGCFEVLIFNRTYIYRWKAALTDAGTLQSVFFDLRVLNAAAGVSIYYVFSFFGFMEYVYILRKPWILRFYVGYYYVVTLMWLFVASFVYQKKLWQFVQLEKQTTLKSVLEKIQVSVILTAS